MNLAFLLFLSFVVGASLTSIILEKENRDKAIHAIVVLVTLVIMWSLIR